MKRITFKKKKTKSLCLKNRNLRQFSTAINFPFFLASKLKRFLIAVWEIVEDIYALFFNLYLMLACYVYITYIHSCE